MAAVIVLSKTKNVVNRALKTKFQHGVHPPSPAFIIEKAKY